MLTVPLTFSLAPFPTGQAVDADAYGQQLVANLQASFTADLLEGQTGGSEPSQDIGPWFDGTQWQAWNPALGAYAPVHSPATRNVVRNGNMQIAQRQTFFGNPGNLVYTIDGYRVEHNLLTATGNVGQLDAPIQLNANFPPGHYSFELTPVITQNTIGSGEYWMVSQAIERQIALPLFGNPTSLSIFLQSRTAGTYCVTLRNNDATWSYVTECVLSGSDVGQWFTIQNIPAFPTLTGDWGTNDTDPCYRIYVCATCGSARQTTTPGIWVNANALATANQTNLFATAGGNYLLFSYLKHEPGPICTPFEAVPFDQDLIACQRYYSQSYDYGLYPGDTSLAGMTEFLGSQAGVVVGTVRYPVPLRVAVTPTIYSATTGTPARIRDNIGATDRVVTGVAGTPGASSFGHITATSFSAPVAGQTPTGLFHWTASADL